MVHSIDLSTHVSLVLPGPKTVSIFPRAYTGRSVANQNGILDHKFAQPFIEDLTFGKISIQGYLLYFQLQNVIHIDWIFIRTMTKSHSHVIAQIDASKK